MEALLHQNGKTWLMTRLGSDIPGPVGVSEPEKAGDPFSFTRPRKTTAESVIKSGDRDRGFGVRDA